MFARYENAQRHLSDFDREMTKGHFDKDKLDTAIDDVKNVVEHNTLDSDARDALRRDLGDLRDVRAEHDRSDAGPVQRVAIVEHAQGGALRRRASLVGDLLRERLRRLGLELDPLQVCKNVELDPRPTPRHRKRAPRGSPPRSRGLTPIQLDPYG